MGEDRAAKKVYLGRPVVYPRRRWSDKVQKDLRDIGTSDWQEKAQNRTLRPSLCACAWW